MSFESFYHIPESEFSYQIYSQPVRSMGDNQVLDIGDQSRGSLVGLSPSLMRSVPTLGSYCQNWVESSHIQLVLEHRRNGAGKEATYLVSIENKLVMYGQLFHMCL